MLVECSECKAALRVPDERISPEGSKFKCPKCGAVLLIKKPSSPAKKDAKETTKSADVRAEMDTGAIQKESTPHSPEPEERRKHERVPFREDIAVDGTKQCTIMDISEDGLYISAIQHFEENSVIDITIPFKGEKLMVKARVQYYQPGIGVGIKLIDMNDEQRSIIKEIIESTRKKPAEP